MTAAMFIKMGTTMCQAGIIPDLAAILLPDGFLAVQMYCQRCRIGFLFPLAQAGYHPVKNTVYLNGIECLITVVIAIFYRHTIMHRIEHCDQHVEYQYHQCRHAHTAV